MSAYEDALLAARFAALAPEALAVDWEDVRDRAARARKGRRHFPGAEVLRSRRRQPLVVLATVLFVVVLGAASALGVRAILATEGIVGLPPEGATPSAPKKGELVLGLMFGHNFGDPGRFSVFVYEDGRMIWQRLGDYSRAVTDEHRNSTGWLERRLTPEGVELVMAEVLSTGLVDHDLHLTTGKGLYFGSIDFRSGDRRVLVDWGNDVSFDRVGKDVVREPPTAEQATALIRLDERLANPASWLPASAWKDPGDRAYVPSGYQACYQGGQGVGLSRLLALLPPPAQRLLRAQENRSLPYTNDLGTIPLWCSQLTNDEARALERILDRAGIRGEKSVFGAQYGVADIADAGPGEFGLSLDPLLPDQWWSSN